MGIVSGVEIRDVAGMPAAMRWADAHTTITDLPEGRAGGKGLGFKGAQLPGLTIGRRLANYPRYVAADMGVAMGDFSISVSVHVGWLVHPRGRRKEAGIGFNV